jgi:hypothetical protein
MSIPTWTALLRAANFEPDDTGVVLLGDNLTDAKAWAAELDRDRHPGVRRIIGVAISVLCARGREYGDTPIVASWAHLADEAVPRRSVPQLHQNLGWRPMPLGEWLPWVEAELLAWLDSEMLLAILLDDEAAVEPTFTALGDRPKDRMLIAAYRRKVLRSADLYASTALLISGCNPVDFRAVRRVKRCAPTAVALTPGPFRRRGVLDATSRRALAWGARTNRDLDAAIGDDRFRVIATRDPDRAIDLRDGRYRQFPDG